MRPKHYWYGIVKKQISMNKKADKTKLQTLIIETAIQEANKETLKLPNGELRLRAVNDILIAQRHNYEGVAYELNYSEKTIKNWINSYVNLVGRKAGY